MEKLLQIIGEQTVNVKLFEQRVQDMGAKIAELEKQIEALKNQEK